MAYPSGEEFAAAAYGISAVQGLDVHMDGMAREAEFGCDLFFAVAFEQCAEGLSHAG